MQTGDAELEMRGRCSAGQKVCYVIIVGFARVFSFDQKAFFVEHFKIKLK